LLSETGIQTGLWINNLHELCVNKLYKATLKSKK